MMLICTSRLDIEEQEAKLLEKVFFHDEMEAAKEEKDEKLDDIEVEPISDTEEQEIILNDGIELDKALSTEPEEQTSRRADYRRIPATTTKEFYPGTCIGTEAEESR